MVDFDNYRLHLLGKAIIQLNERLGYPLDEALLSKLEENFQYTFGEEYSEPEEE